MAKRAAKHAKLDYNLCLCAPSEDNAVSESRSRYIPDSTRWMSRRKCCTVSSYPVYCCYCDGTYLPAYHTSECPGLHTSRPWTWFEYPGQVENCCMCDVAITLSGVADRYGRDCSGLNGTFVTDLTAICSKFTLYIGGGANPAFWCGGEFTGPSSVYFGISSYYDGTFVRWDGELTKPSRGSCGGSLTIPLPTYYRNADVFCDFSNASCVIELLSPCTA